MKPQEHTMSAKDLYVMHRLYYWMIGGVVTAAQKAVSYAHAESMEFFNAAAILAMGLWVVMVGAINASIPTILSIPELFIPRWAFGLMLIIIDRVAMDFMLSNDANKREWGQFFLLGSWLYMAVNNWIAHGFNFVSALFLTMTAVTALLYLIIQRNNKPEPAEGE